MKASSRIYLETSEKILAAAGIFILLSVPLLFFTESFVVWIAAKILYGIGVLVFVFNK